MSQTARFDWLQTVYAQYANSPVLLSIVDAMSQWLDPADLINFFYDNVWNIDTAQGWGLDVWGRIVGINRVLQAAPSKYLGFDEAGTLSADPFGQSPFYAGEPAVQNYTLSDAAFRQLILAKAAANIWDGSIPGLNRILRLLFPGLLCYVTDGEDMTMTYTFGFALSPVQQTIITVPAAASTLTGTTLAAGVTASSLTSVGAGALAASATTDTTNASNIGTGTLAAARGGAGAVTGILKANGSGLVSTAAAASDYVAPATTVNGHALTANVTVSASDVGLGSVTNDAQTKAAIVPNTAPTAGQVLVGNAGGTAYAVQSIGGDAALSSLGALTVTKTNGASFAASATTDTTNATNIGAGTLGAARLPAALANSTSINGLAITASTGTLTVTNAKTLSASNSLTLAGTDSTTITFPSTSATVARTDAGQTFTGTQAFGTLTATTVNGNTITAGTGVLTLAASKTLTASNTLTLAGTDSTTMTFPSTSATIARTDAANTFTGHQTIEGVTSTGATGSGALVFGTSPTFTTSLITPLVRSTVAKVLVQGTGTGATQLAATQTTVPTCTTSCGTSPSIAGTDTAGIVTMGASGTPASGWVVTFNGTWATAPACIVQSALASMVVGKMSIAVVTTTTTMTVTTNGTAPAASDKYQFHCIGTQ